MAETHSGYYSCDASEAVKNSMLYAIGGGMCSYKSGETIQSLTADHYVIAIILEGKLICSAYNCQKTLVKNDLLLLPPGSLKSASCLQNACIQTITYNGPPASGYHTLMNSSEEFVFRPQSLNYIHTAISEIIEIMRRRSPDPAQISLLLTTVLTHLCSSSIHEQHDSEETIINHALQRILHCVTDPPSVQTLANEAGYSLSHFIRVFCRHTGLTPRQYIISVRIEQAKHLLATTGLPLRSIASLIGYTSESMFCTAFKNVTDLTPGDYRAAVTGESRSESNETLHVISDAIIAGNYADIGNLCRNALIAQCSGAEILKTMIQAMHTVNELYVRKDILLSEMLSSAKAIKKGLSVVRPEINGREALGTAIIGTAEGDLHDIGKNLVALMLESIGFEIIDLGVDVSANAFIAAWREHPNTHLIVISALLSSARAAVKSTVHRINEQPERDNVKVIVGGGAITEEFAMSIGAEAYTADAVSAALKAQELVMGNKEDK